MRPLLIATLVGALSLYGCGVTPALARPYSYCDDASGNTLALIIKADEALLHDPETSAAARESVRHSVEVIRECPVYKAYRDYCGEDRCDD
jgi:hypothetical protein